jgi:hypothetical protein
LDLGVWIERIQNWLTTSPIQVMSNSDEGGIVSWLDGTGQPSAVYGEITGYYLTYAHFVSIHGGVNEKSAMRAGWARNWLRSIWQISVPLTRYYVNPGVDDWRNRAIFSFDLAMMLRGLSWDEQDENRRTQNLIIQKLNQFIAADGTILTHRTLGDGHPLPVKWSTQPHPFQVKTASAILLTKDVAENVQTAARKTIARWQDYYLDHPLTGDLHPLFYYLEGLFLLEIESGDRHYGNYVTQIYSQIMEKQAENGSLPANFDHHPPSIRSDVLAQALRIGCLLVSENYLEGSIWLNRLDLLAQSLLGYLHPSGCVGFEHTEPAGIRHWNVWCTMFTYQAFCYYETLQKKGRIAKAWQKLLV